MVHRSMKNGSTVADELYIKRVLIALEDFLFFSLYSFSCIANNSPTLEYILSLFLVTHFEFSPATFTSPASDPARYTRTSHPYTHLIADVLSTLPDSLF